MTLTVIGHEEIESYGRSLRALAATRPWFRIVHDLSREELAATIARHRYGIHAQEEEHFGIGPAEIQKAGCITFVHNSGGPVEIVGGEAALTYDGVGDAVEKISRVLTDKALEARMREHVARQRERFTAEHFCESLRGIVRAFADSSAALPANIT